MKDGLVEDSKPYRLVPARTLRRGVNCHHHQHPRERASIVADELPERELSKAAAACTCSADVPSREAENIATQPHRDPRNSQSSPMPNIALHASDLVEVYTLAPEAPALSVGVKVEWQGR